MKRTRAEVWFMAMIFCFATSTMTMLVMAFRDIDSRLFAIPVLLGLWAPVLGVLGVRAQLLHAMGVPRDRAATYDDARWEPRTVGK